MKEFIQIIKNIWSIKELKKKILFTFFLVVLYRLGSFITIPAINLIEVENVLEAYQNSNGNKQTAGLLGLLSSFTGGALSRASIFSLGIMPYISASIFIQVMSLIVPFFKKMQSDGESGRKATNQIIRWVTILISIIQSIFYLTTLTKIFLPVDQYLLAYSINPIENPFLFYIPSIFILTSGTIFSMWLGEKITDKGIGNGISILIMIGILADLPTAFLAELELQNSAIMFLFEILFWLLVVVLCIMLVNSVRKVRLQYVKTRVSITNKVSSLRNYIPLKVNTPGVMPIIFSQALMFIPGLFSKNLKEGSNLNFILNKFSDMFSWQYNLLFATLIVIFTFLYTAMTIPVNQIAEDLKRQGALIPKIKPGTDTEEYLDEVLSRITLPGAILLALVAILPTLVKLIGLTITDKFALFFGGTSLLVMVGVLLDTIQQINTYLLNHHYDGLMSNKFLKKNSLY